MRLAPGAAIAGAIASMIGASGGAARADDKTMVVDVEGGVGAVVPRNAALDGTATAPAIGVGRAIVSWVPAPLPWPEEHSARFAADIEPELVAGFLGNDVRGDGFGEVGLRLDVAFAQHGMGLFHVSTRGGLWLAARGGMVGGEHNTMIEGDLGWYLWLGDTGWRLGWEMGAMGVKNPTDASGVAMPLYAPQAEDVSRILHFDLFVGTRL